MNKMNVVRLGANYEYATICWESWNKLTKHGEPLYSGEILIHSSYGTWAHYWGHCGEPFETFLADLDRSYAAGKFLGTKASVFDGEATVKGLRQSLLEDRRAGNITKNDARSIWDWIDSNEFDLENGDEGNFINRLIKCTKEADWCDVQKGKYAELGPGRGARHFLEEPWERPCHKIDPQFEGFWREIWPLFLEHLKRVEINQSTIDHEWSEIK